MQEKTNFNVICQINGLTSSLKTISATPSARSRDAGVRCSRSSATDPETEPRLVQAAFQDTARSSQSQCAQYYCKPGVMSTSVWSGKSARRNRKKALDIVYCMRR